MSYQYLPYQQTNQVQYSTASDLAIQLNYSDESFQQTEKKLPSSRQRIKEHSRLLPEKAVDIMTQWYDRHYSNPYPTYRDYELLAQAGAITIPQVKQWFVNVRRRTQNQFRKKREATSTSTKSKRASNFTGLSQFDSLDSEVGTDSMSAQIVSDLSQLLAVQDSSPRAVLLSTPSTSAQSSSSTSPSCAESVSFPDYSSFGNSSSSSHSSLDFNSLSAIQSLQSSSSVTSDAAPFMCDNHNQFGAAAFNKYAYYKQATSSPNYPTGSSVYNNASYHPSSSFYSYQYSSISPKSSGQSVSSQLQPHQLQPSYNSASFTSFGDAYHNASNYMASPVPSFSSVYSCSPTSSLTNVSSASYSPSFFDSNGYLTQRQF